MLRRLVCAALLVSLACGGRPNQAPATSASGAPAPERRANPFLDLVPADTPYLYVSTVSSADYFRAEMARTAPAWRRLSAALERVRRERPKDFADLPPVERAVLALLDELGPKLDAESLARLGLDLDGRLALYGLGLMPVFRFEIADAGRLDATVARIEAAARLEPRRERVAGRSVRRYAVDDLELVISFADGEGVLALLPAGVLPEVAPVLFGDERPERSLADAGILDQLVARFDVPGSFVGYVDFALIARAAAGSGTGAAAAIARALDLGTGESQCLEELLGLTSSAPRLVFGAAVTADRLHAKTVLELSPELSRQLAELRAPAPGLRPALSRGAPFALSLGVDVGATIDLVAGKLAALGRAEYQCEDLAWIPGVAAELGAGLARGRATPLASVRGASAIVRELDHSGADTRLRYALAFVGSDDPAALVSLIATLAGAPALTLRPGDPPARLLDVPDLPDPVYLAVTHTAIGASAGAGAESELEAVLSRPPDPEPPLLMLRMAPELGIAADESVDDDYAAVAAADPELEAALRELDQQDLLRYRELLLVIEAEAHGLALYIDFPYASD